MRWPFFNFKKRISKNNRRFQRARIPLLIRYRVAGEDRERVSNLKDLAAVGVRFISEREIKPFRRIRLTIKLPWSDEPFKAWAKVVRCIQVKKEPGFCIAARFVGLERSKVFELESLIDGIIQGRNSTKKATAKSAMLN